MLQSSLSNDISPPHIKANQSSTILGEHRLFAHMYERKVITKAQKITNDETHILSQYFELLPSGRRCGTIKCRKVKNPKSFVPFSIQAMNKTFKCAPFVCVRACVCVCVCVVKQCASM